MPESSQQVLKRKKLRQFKMLALSLLLLMACIYIVSSLFIDQYSWLGYTRAFAEAAMVGGLADWFAVTALFHYPMGIKIPHTNLIENSKQRIGENLGDFVVQNFVTPEIIRPRLDQFSIASKLGDWLAQEKNRQPIINEVFVLAEDLLQQADKTQLAKWFSQQAQELAGSFNAGNLLSDVLQYVLANDKHVPLIDAALDKLAEWISGHESFIRERVKKESSALIPGFVDNMIAKKITHGFIAFADEIRDNPQHPIRLQIDEQLHDLSIAVKEDPQWHAQLEEAKKKLISGAAIEAYAQQAVTQLLDALFADLHKENSSIKNYLDQTLLKIAHQLQTDTALCKKIDGWVRFHAFRLAMKNREAAGNLISQTVGNWQGAELSQKLELEVGKDLQFIRINGTLVGGIVGVLIYLVTQWIKHL
jgi:uncharacterized membrane-anchored protein YjiN (DUF445 family)